MKIHFKKCIVPQITCYWYFSHWYFKIKGGSKFATRMCLSIPLKSSI